MMPNSTLIRVLVVACCATGSPISEVLAESAEEFFARYRSLSEQFDPAVADLYADDATISAYRRYPHGLEREMSLSGIEYKELIVQAMPNAKARGDTSNFTNVRYTIEGTRTRIKADRYSRLKCYTDSGYYMVVEDDGAGRQIIVEEYLETQPQSDCQSADSDLDEALRQSAQQLEGMLPTMVDEDTRLDRVSIGTAEFRYEYTLVKYYANELDRDYFLETISPIVGNQTCNAPNIRPLLDKGASIVYIYRGKGGDEFARLTFEPGGCD